MTAEIPAATGPAASERPLPEARAKAWGARLLPGADAAAGAGAVFTRGQRLALLALFLLLAMLRLPEVWRHGRLLGEEGAIFFAYAWHRPAGEALWRSFASYLNLGANGATLLLARLVRGGAVPLEFAPYVTQAIATGFQAVPALLVLGGRGRWLANRWAVIGALLIMVVSPTVEEVFANSMHIGYHLALAAGLIVALDVPAGRAGRFACLALLGLGPLCGPGAILVLPVFVLRWLADRDRARLMQLLALAGGAAVQMLWFYSQSPMRSQLLDPVSLANILFLRLAVAPYLSAPVSMAIGQAAFAAWRDGGGLWWGLSAAAFAWLGLLGWLALSRRDAACWLIVAGLAIGVASFGAGMLLIDPSQWFSVKSAERYNFLPMVLIGLGMVAVAMRGEPLQGWLATRLVLLTLVSGALTFAMPADSVGAGPAWREEVGAWRRNHDYRLRGWPGHWAIDLSDRSRPCSPLRGDRDILTDPAYCETSWAALVRADSRRGWSWMNAEPAR